MRDKIYEDALHAINELRAKYGIGDGWPLTEMPAGVVANAMRCPVTRALRCSQTTYQHIWWDSDDQPSWLSRFLSYLKIVKIIPCEPLPMPEAIRLFMTKFDHHEYPELDENTNVNNSTSNSIRAIKLL